MAGTYNIPSDSHVVGDTGHTTDHDDIAAMLTLLATGSGFNVKMYGAVGDGSTDDTTAFQDTLNAIATNGGGTMLIPRGEYLISSELTYNPTDTTTTLQILGSGSCWHNDHTANTAGLTTIFYAVNSPSHCFDIRNCISVRFQDMNILCKGTSEAATDDYSGIYTNTVNDVTIQRVYIDQAYTYSRFNSAAHLVLGSDFNYINQCRLLGRQEGIWLDSGAVYNISNSLIGGTSGNGYGGVRMDDTTNGSGAATLSMSDCLILTCDNGLYLGPCTATDNRPSFIYLSNVQINRPQVCGIYCATGSQFWANYVWISMDGNSGGLSNSGIIFDTGYVGLAYIQNSVLQGCTEYGILINAGQGFAIDTTSFGACGNKANNTYDDLHIAAAAENVSVTGCHFEVDEFMTMSGNKPRSGIYIEDGATNVLIAGNILATGYGTSSLVDSGDAATKGANINLST